MAQADPSPEILDSSQRLVALRLVREAVESWTTQGHRIPIPPDSGLSRLRVPAFVTLTLELKLRGCIGCLEPDRPLDETLVDCAIAAASHDSRFPPVTAQELLRLRCEISLLTPPEPLGDPRNLRVGLDGLLVEMSGRRGLLLPQVAREQKWDRETFLDHVCLKAGLKAGDWRRGARVWVFRAQVFAEGGPA